MVRISELTESVKTWTPSKSPDDEFEYIDLSAVDNDSKLIAAATTVTGSEAPSRARQLVAEGDILVSTVRPNLNAVAVVPAELDGATASTGFTVLRPAAALNGRFLFHWVRSHDFISDMVRKATGASYPAVSDRIVKESAIPAHPLNEQRRIAAILDHADDLRAKRRRVLSHLDILTQSIFYDMFGDPLRNDRGLQRAALGSVAEVVTGNSPPRADTANFGESIEWIKSDNLGSEMASHAEEWLSDQGRRRARIAPAGSVLVTCIAGSRTSIGKCSRVDHDVAFNQQINAVLPSVDLNPAFLLGQLKVAPELVRLKSTGGMKGLVNKSAFKSIEILLPPVTEQGEFARRLESLSSQRALVLAARTAEDELFTSLQSRAFRSEL